MYQRVQTGEEILNVDVGRSQETQTYPRWISEIFMLIPTIQVKCDHNMMTTNKLKVCEKVHLGYHQPVAPIRGQLCFGVTSLLA